MNNHHSSTRATRASQTMAAANQLTGPANTVSKSVNFNNNNDRDLNQIESGKSDHISNSIVNLNNSNSNYNNNNKRRILQQYDYDSDQHNHNYKSKKVPDPDDGSGRLFQVPTLDQCSKSVDATSSRQATSSCLTPNLYIGSKIKQLNLTTITTIEEQDSQPFQAVNCNRKKGDSCNNLFQHLPNSLALNALNYLSNIRDSDQLASFNRPCLTSFSKPRLSPTTRTTQQEPADKNHNLIKQLQTRQRKVHESIINFDYRKFNSSAKNSQIPNSKVNRVRFSDQSDSESDFGQLRDRKSNKNIITKQEDFRSKLFDDDSSNSQSLVNKLQLKEGKDRKYLDHNNPQQDKTVSETGSNMSKVQSGQVVTQKFASNSKSETTSYNKSKKFYLAMVTLLIISILVGFCQVNLTTGQQLAPRSHNQAQLTPTIGTNSQSNSNGLNGVGLPPPPRQQASGPQHIAGSLVANVNCNKIRAHVTLTPSQQSSVTVNTQIYEGPPGEVYQWSVHQFPVKPGAAMCTCSPLILGSKLIDLGEMHGNLPSNQEFSVQSSTLSLFGPDSPVGHSLLLRGLKTGVLACATFLPTSRKSNYRAKFHEPLSGSVTIFQTAFGSSFLSHLMYSNGTRRHSVHRFDLVKSDEDMLLLNSGHRPLTVAPSQSTSNTLLVEQREHDNEISQCRRFTSGEALLRNMTYQLSVSTENFGMRSRTALVLPQIPFETFSSVYVIVYSEHNPLEPIACAPLKFVKPKTAAAKFQTASVQGNVVFSQDSPYDPTQARITLQLPNSDGHSYGIDELPMIIRRKSDTRVCPNIREIIYNPHHIEPSSVPGEGEATSDQYAVGDLSGKYGSLAGKSSERIQVSDFNLPLFGPNSIVGRAMTIYSAEGVAIACSNVELTTPMTTAFATFDFGIQGQFIFRQAQNDCNGDTYVYIEVSRPVQPPVAGQQANTNVAATSNDPSHNHHHSRTLDHNWHIHVNPIDSGLDHLSTTECSAAGPHFNPYNTSTASIYSRDCTPFNVLRCELGDLASKMFTLEIPPYRVKSGQEPDIGKFFGTDIDLPLCGPVSVVNRSVVVHGPDFGANRLACSTIIEFKPRS